MTSVLEFLEGKTTTPRDLYRVYVFRFKNRVNSEVNSVSGKIKKFDEFDRVDTR